VRLAPAKGSGVTAAPFGPSTELSAALADVVADDAELATVKLRPRLRAEETSRGYNLSEWWRGWRRTAGFRGLVTFILVYGALALVRQPSAAVREQSRHAEEMAALQNFLKSYAAAGGFVLAEKPHGGTELYPRGIVLQGDLLAAFRRAAAGETLTVNNPAWNPIAAFYGYPPIYAGGDYFHLDRRFSLTNYRFQFLIRKDSEQAGRLLLAKVEPAF
jgi:hypothetical protein